MQHKAIGNLKGKDDKTYKDLITTFKKDSKPKTKSLWQQSELMNTYVTMRQYIETEKDRTEMAFWRD